MTLPAHVLATAVAILSGLGLLSLLRRPGLDARSAGERIALGYLAGILYLGAGMLLLAAASVPLTTATGWVLQAPALALFARDRIRGRRGAATADAARPETPSRRRAAWEWILLALIGAKLAWVLSMDLTALYRTDDAFKWSLGLARHVHDTGAPAGYLLPAGYPKVPGLLLAWFGMLGGRWDEFGVNLAHWNYYAALLLLFHENLRALSGARAALLGTYVLSGFPLLLVHAVSAGYADLPLAILVCFAGVYAYRYAREGMGDDRALALLFAASMLLFKLEGRMLLAPALLALAAAEAWRRGRPRPGEIWLAAGGLALAAVAAVLLLERAYGVEGPPFLGSLWGNLLPGNRLSQVAGPLGEHFGWHFNNWMIAGTLAALAFPALAIVFARRAEHVLGLYGALLLAAFLYLYLVGGAYLWLVTGTVVNRSFLQILPALLFGTVVMLTLLVEDASPPPEAGERRERARRSRPL